MQITFFNVFAQVITGPNTAQYGMSATYHIAKPSPNVLYDWGTVGNTGFITNPYANNSNYHKVDIGWVGTAPYTITVTETPVISNTGTHLTVLAEPLLKKVSNQVLPVDSTNPYINDAAIQDAIDDMWAIGGGTVVIEEGEYYVGKIFLREGVRLIGKGKGVTILKRLVDGGYPYWNHFLYSAMISTFRFTGSGTEFSFLPHNSFSANPDENSKPIEIADMTLNNNNPNLDATVYWYDANANTWWPTFKAGNGDAYQRQHLITLEVPTSALVGQVVNYDVPGQANSPLNNYSANGSGKLKVFIHDVEFMYAGGDGVHQYENVELNMHDCTGYSAYRGTFSLTGGGGLSRVAALSTEVTMTGSRSIDLEMDADATGYSPPGFPEPGYRAWIDDCELDFAFHLDFLKSKLLVTNTEVIKKQFGAAPAYAEITVVGPLGQFVCRNATFPFHNIFNAGMNSINASMRARFIDCEFHLLYYAPDICGMGFKMHETGLAGSGSEIGFEECLFSRDANFGPTVKSFGIIYNKDYGPSDFTFYDYQNDYSPQHETLFQPYENDNGCADYDDANSVLHTPTVPVVSGKMLPGESEDDMKEHFGIHRVTVHENFNCNTSLLNDNTVHLLDNPTASEVLHFYGSGGVVSNKKFYINGEFKIDEGITFDNGCELYFTEEGSIVLQDNATLDINTSTLQAACEWWIGIAADGASQKLIIQSGSIIKNMKWGIRVHGNSLVEISDSYFIDNGHCSFQFGDMTDVNYAGFIERNHFLSVTTRPLPFPKTEFGITTSFVSKLNIGDVTDPYSGNTFDGMYCGIRIDNIQNGISSIGIYNNVFNNIHSDINNDYTNLVNCFTNHRGAAIFSKADGNPNAISYLDIQNHAGFVQYNFENCDKAIVSLGSGLTAKKQRADDCLLGIMCNSVYNRNFVLENNLIIDAHIGISVSGFPRSTSIVNNEIRVNKSILSGYNKLAAPIGIKFDLSAGLMNVGLYPHQIADNNITVSTITGIGIYNGNTNWRLEEKNNTVAFTTINTVPSYNHTIHSLYGYWNENNYKSRFLQNTTNGIPSAAVWPTRSSMSMYMNHSQQCVLHCNRLKFTWYGFFVWGKNNTEPENVTFNKCNANEFPWLFYDGPSPGSGSFGNVGGTNDNGNEFLSTNNLVDWRGLAGYNTDEYKVVRNGSGTFSDKISTDPSLLDLFESGPATSFRYDVGIPDNSGYDDPCEDNNNNDPDYITEPSIDSSEYNNFIAIAMDSVDYINFPNVGSWIDKYRLYNELNHDSLLLNSSAEFLYFYSTTSSQTIGAIADAVDKIGLLYDSTTNSGNDSVRYAEAVAANTLISSANQWEINEKTVNDVLLFLYKNPIDSVSIEMKEAVQVLASSCPFVEGSSVYRARPIYNLWEPNAIFDDRLLCIQGQNKNQDNTNLNIDSLIANEIKSQMKGRPIDGLNFNNQALPPYKILYENNSGIKVYPNPASTFIIIEYNERADGHMKLFNKIGQIILQTELGDGNRKVQLELKDVATGFYFYKINFGEKEYLGKLNIVK